jgi:hypothetical protein
VTRETILSELEAVEWPYALNDENGVLQEFQDRICRTARLGTSLISYSNLVAGINFRFSNVNNGQPFIIDVHDWHGLHRRIVGDCLGYLSYISYRDYDFMASSLVAGLAENRPSEIFFEWRNELGAIPDMSEESITSFWVSEVNKAIAWYRRNPRGFQV